MSQSNGSIVCRASGEATTGTISKPDEIAPGRRDRAGIAELARGRPV
jgi:hypothetical protein